MSEIMQGQRLRQSSKFVEGRLKLSTSCVECHRRKQKCDQKQPCGHCARRYPPPSCIYRTLRQVSGSSKDGSERIKSLPSPTKLKHGSSVESRLLRGEESIDGEDTARQWLTATNQEQQTPESGQASVSFESLEHFSSNVYQQRVTAMISDLSSAVLSNSHVAEIPLLKLSGEGRESKLLVAFRGDPAGSYDSDEITSFRYSSSHYVAAPQLSNFGISSSETLQHLGITPTVQTAQLLQTFLKIVSKYGMSIDGNALPNYYNDYWVPWSVKSPLLANLGILTAAIYQAEAQKVPSGRSPIALHYKVKSIGLLNEMLENRESATSTEAIAAVVSLLINEWFWLHRDAVKRHMAGLKLIIELRGGLDELGMNGFPRKLVLHNDYNVACSYEIEPTFLHDVSARPEHPVEMSIPFVISEWDFGSCAEQLEICTETAAILDDMRFLFLALTKHVQDDTREEEPKKLITTARWIQDRIASLPDGSSVGSPLASDHVYKSCRVAASIFCKAILERIPLSKVCTPQDLNLLWASMWQVKLSRWKQTPGIFFFVLASVLSAAEDAPHGRFTKAMFRTTTSYIGLDYFELIDAALMAVVRMQRWLRTGVESGM